LLVRDQTRDRRWVSGCDTEAGRVTHGQMSRSVTGETVVAGSESQGKCWRVLSGSAPLSCCRQAALAVEAGQLATDERQER
jgi:hypothetical protein